jgi:DGQHR domain-containing protein
MSEIIRYGTVSLIRQGDHRFFTFTMPSEILAKCCFVVNREEDPELGFQRELDINRAKEIAKYIDSGFGTIPSSIILSAQEDSEFEYDSKRKSITFKDISKAFLIIDGQHRVYGFKLSKTSLRVPVVVYENLSKRDESRLFIDINSKQRGVPPELLLDIKKLAEYENDIEQYLRELFDIFHREQDSILYNKLSPAKRTNGKITRTVFNTSLKPLIKVFGNKIPEEVYEIFNSYLIAFNEGVLIPNQKQEKLFNTTIFKAIAGFFPIVTSRVKDRFGAIYSVDNYYEFLNIVGSRIKPSKFENQTSAYKPLIDHFVESLNTDFSL